MCALERKLIGRAKRANMDCGDRGNRLRWSISVPEPRFGANVSPTFLAAAARNVESAGFDGIWVSDHPLPVDLSIPREAGSALDVRLGAGHQTWDPFCRSGMAQSGNDSG